MQVSDREMLANALYNMVIDSVDEIGVVQYPLLDERIKEVWLAKAEALIKSLDIRFGASEDTKEEAAEVIPYSIRQPEKAWVQFRRNGAWQHIEIPFWVLVHLRAVNGASLINPDYPKRYQEGLEGGVISDWLTSFAFESSVTTHETPPTEKPAPMPML
jgi:hypothetical protein